MIQSKDLHWLAGLIEGEGSFGWHQIKKRPNTSGTPVLQLKMTDADVVKRAAALFNRPVRQYGKTKTGKLVYCVIFNGKDAVGWMMTLFSLLGTRRRQRIKEIVSKWKLTPNRKKFV